MFFFLGGEVGDKGLSTLGVFSTIHNLKLKKLISWLESVELNGKNLCIMILMKPAKKCMGYIQFVRLTLIQKYT